MTDIEKELNRSKNENQILQMTLELSSHDFEKIVKEQWEEISRKEGHDLPLNEIVVKISKALDSISRNQFYKKLLDNLEAELIVLKQMGESGKCSDEDMRASVFKGEIEETERQKGKEAKILTNFLTINDQLRAEINKRIKEFFLKIHK